MHEQRQRAGGAILVPLVWCVLGAGCGPGASRGVDGGGADAAVHDAGTGPEVDAAAPSDAPSGPGDRDASDAALPCMENQPLSDDGGLLIFNANLGVLGSFPCGSSLPNGSLTIVNTNTAPIAWTASAAGAAVDIAGSTLQPDECVHVTVALTDPRLYPDGLGLRRGTVTVAYASTTQDFQFSLDVFGSTASVPPVVDLGTVTLAPDAIPADGGTPSGSVSGSANFDFAAFECPEAQCTFGGQLPALCTFGTALDSELQAGCGNACAPPFEMGVGLAALEAPPGLTFQVGTDHLPSGCGGLVVVSGVASPGVYTVPYGASSTCDNGGGGVLTLTVLPPPSE